MKYGTYRNDPRQIEARFNSKCDETGKEIKKGDFCVYYPIGKKVYHMDSEQARKFREEAFDNEVLRANY